jgi:hypothetical protein
MPAIAPVATTVKKALKRARTTTHASWLLPLAAAALISLLLAGLAQPAVVAAQEPPAPVPGGSFVSPLDTPTPLPTVTWTPMPTPTDTPTATPTFTPTPTFPAFQVSPLLIESGPVAGPANDVQLWIGAAALLVLAGSVILLVGAQQNEK